MIMLLSCIKLWEIERVKFFYLIYSLKEYENDNFRFVKDVLFDFKYCVLDGIYCI